MTTAGASAVCPECGLDPARPPRWRCRVWGLWPLGLAGVLFILVLGWAPRQSITGSVLSGSVHRPLKGDITVGELRAMAAGERPTDRLREALFDPDLASGLVPELADAAVGTVPNVLAEEVSDYSPCHWGFPAPWGVWLRQRDGTEAARGPGPTWWVQWGHGAFTLNIRTGPTLDAIMVRLDGRFLLVDFILPAAVFAVAGILRGRMRRWAWVMAAVGLAAGLSWPTTHHYRWVTSPTSTHALHATLSDLRARTGTAEARRGLAASLLSAAGGGDDAVVVLGLASEGWGDLVHVRVPGFDVVAMSEVCGSAGAEVPPGLGFDDNGIRRINRPGATGVRLASVTWQGVGLVAGIPAVLWLIWAAGRGVWRVRTDGRRRRGGCCRSCGYDVRGAGP